MNRRSCYDDRGDEAEETAEGLQLCADLGAVGGAAGDSPEDLFGGHGTPAVRDAAGTGAGAEGPGGQHGAERQRGFFVWQSAGKEAG